jgi:hypothetical protein
MCAYFVISVMDQMVWGRDEGRSGSNLIDVRTMRK